MATTNQQVRPARVIIVDDHAFAREAVGEALDAEPDLEIVGLAGTVADARVLIDNFEPDIAILDLQLPDGSGRELVEYCTKNQPELRSIVYTSALRPGQAESLTEAGADAVLLKSLRGSELLDTIRKLIDAKPPDVVPRPFSDSVWGEP